MGNLTTDDQGQHFSLIPYSFEDKIYFIITYICGNNILKINHYQINTENNYEALITKQIDPALISDFHHSLNCTISLHSHKYLICFFMESKWIYSFTFDIKDEFNIINITNTTCEDCQDEGNSNLDSSSISINQNKNEILICYKYNDKKNSHCYFYNIDNNSFNKNYTITDCKRYITASYFIETQEFIVICNPEGKEVNLYEINANNKEQKLYFVENATDFGCNFLKFFLSYNSIKNEYNLINDCYKNHTYIYLLNI